jgi:HTH-type transcriptional regulator/antitoxin HigA
MDIHPIKTEQDYASSLRRIEALMLVEPETPEADELNILATLVSEYEDKNFPIDSPDPVEAILFRMDQMGLSRADLEKFIGSRGRVSEVLTRKRALSITMIRKLHAGLRIPLENLIGEGA